MKHPRFTDAHVGPLELQSAHLLFSSSFSKELNSLRCASFWAFVTAVLLFI